MINKNSNTLHYTRRSNLTLIVAYILEIPLTLIYFLSFLIPKDKNIWIFGSWEGRVFCDNSKYFFLYVSNKNKDSKHIRAIWLSKNKKIIEELIKKGYEAYYTNSLKGIYYALRAKMVVIDHAGIIDPIKVKIKYPINLWLCGRAKILQLWHGVGVKKIDHNTIKRESLSKIWRYLHIISKFLLPWKSCYTFCITTSDFFVPIFASAFDINKKKIIVSGYPRNDVLFKEIGDSAIGMQSQVYQNIIEHKSKKNKIILYAPTFRDSGSNILINGNFDFDKLTNFLELNNAVLFIKYHQAGEHLEYKNLKRIIFLPNDFDLYTILKYVDILITDYSSIFFDFLLLNKPIIFFPFDIQKYISKDRELYFDYDEFVPGPKAYTFDELLEWINYFVNGNDDFAEKRKKIGDLGFKYVDGNSSKRIYDFILNYL